MKMTRMLFLTAAVFLAVFAAGAAEQSSSSSRIVVSAEGKANAVPDMAVIVLGVETRNSSAMAASAENADRMNLVVSALRKDGVKDDEMETSRYTIYFETRDVPGYANGQAPQISEFVVANQVTINVNVTDNKNISKVLDAAEGAGSNRVDGIYFELKDPGPVMDMAIRDAVKNAIDKAEVIASAAGLKLGNIVEISEPTSVQPVYNNVAYSGGLSRSATPIMQGRIELMASVTVIYEVVGKA
jgi:uncharacterized protein YggE